MPGEENNAGGFDIAAREAMRQFNWPSAGIYRGEIVEADGARFVLERSDASILFESETGQQKRHDLQEILPWKTVLSPDYDGDGDSEYFYLDNYSDAYVYDYWTRERVAFFAACYDDRCGQRPVALVLDRRTGDVLYSRIMDGAKYLWLESGWYDNSSPKTAEENVFFATIDDVWDKNTAEQEFHIYRLNVVDCTLTKLFTGQLGLYGLDTIDRLYFLGEEYIRIENYGNGSWVLPLLGEAEGKVSLSAEEICGVWHSGSTDGGVSGARYLFYPDGRFAYAAGEDDETLVRAEGGRWALEGDTLLLTVEERLTIQNNFTVDMREGLRQYSGAPALEKLDEPEEKRLALYRDSMISNGAFYEKGIDVLWLGSREFIKIREGKNADALDALLVSWFGEYAKQTELLHATRPAPPSETDWGERLVVFGPYEKETKYLGTGDLWVGPVLEKLGIGGAGEDGVMFLLNEPKTDYSVGLWPYEEWFESDVPVLFSIAVSNGTADEKQYFYRVMEENSASLQEAPAFYNAEKSCWELFTTGGGAFVSIDRPLPPELVDTPLPQAVTTLVEQYRAGVSAGAAGEDNPETGG